jgi:hypothetical protein
MKKLLIPILFVSGFFAFYEQSKAKPNLYITVVAIAVFMLSIMQLSFKVPHKNNTDNHEDDVS